MNVTRDAGHEDHVLAGLGQLLQRNDASRLSEIHVSDLVYCTRRAVLNRLLPKTLDRRTLVTFVVGRAQHEVLQALGGESEVNVNVGGIIGTIDLAEDGREVVEIKGTRSSLGKHERNGFANEAKNYVEQVMSYCAMKYHASPGERFLVAHVLVVYINGSYGNDMKPDLRSWRVQFTPAELEAWYAELQQRKAIIETSYAALQHLRGDEEALGAVAKALVQELPPRAPRFAFECRDCSFHDFCYPEEADA